jgi:hypothetical protein
MTECGEADEHETKGADGWVGDERVELFWVETNVCRRQKMRQIDGRSEIEVD